MGTVVGAALAIAGQSDVAAVFWRVRASPYPPHIYMDWICGLPDSLAFGLVVRSPVGCRFSAPALAGQQAREFEAEMSHPVVDALIGLRQFEGND